MTRPILLALAALLTACGGGGSDSDTDGEGGVIGDGVRPVVQKAEWACFTDGNGLTSFYFRLTVDDQQGAETIASSGASVLLKDSSGEPLDWDGDGTGDPDTTFDLFCLGDTDPRRCQDALLESDITGPCDGNSLQFEGWAVDEDGNESDHVTTFEQNGGILPSGA